jgi:predicted component of type VI protein secretion system
MLNVELRVTEGRQQGKSIPLTVRQFLIGREQDCHLRPNSDLVSRHHCVFTVDDYTVRLRDLGSTNGTFVNGERIQGQVVLKPGDEVSVGKLKFKVVVNQTAAVGAAVSDKSSSSTQLEPPSVPEIPIEPEPASPAHMDTSLNISDTIEMPARAAPAGDAGSGDTAVFPAPAGGAEQPVAQLQPGYGAPPGYPMAGYPGYPPGGYPGMPGYPPGYGAPMPYGQPQFAPPGYPAPGYPPGYGMPYPPPAEQPPAKKSIEIPEVILPDPSTTGAVAPPPPAPPPPAPAAGEGAPEGAAPPPAETKKPSEAAADIIRMHRLRRPNT